MTGTDYQNSTDTSAFSSKLGVGNSIVIATGNSTSGGSTAGSGASAVTRPIAVVEGSIQDMKSWMAFDTTGGTAIGTTEDANVKRLVQKLEEEFLEIPPLSF